MYVGTINRYKLVICGLIILVVTTGFLVRDLRAYREVGAQPSDLNVAQVEQIAASKDFSARWIRLTDSLQLKCEQSMGWEEDNKTTIVVLAFDQLQQQPFWLEYKSNHNCEDLKSLPLQGLLVRPEKFWIKQGMVQPASAHPLMELKVGETPADLRKNICTWTGADLLAIVLLMFAYKVWPRQKTVKPRSLSRENPWAVAGPANKNR